MFFWELSDHFIHFFLLEVRSCHGILILILFKRRGNNMTNNNPSRPPVFNFRLQRLFIGIFAFFIPVWAILFPGCELPSISASYHSGIRDFFVTFLTCVGCLMIPYRGKNGKCITEPMSFVLSLLSSDLYSLALIKY